MNMPTLLMYNLQNQKGAKIKMLCHKKHIAFKSVDKSLYNCKILDLLSGENTPRENPSEDFSDEMLLFADFNNQLLNDFLKSMNTSKSYVALKAVLTEHNGNFTSIQLHNEISAEHNALKNGKTAH